MAENRDKLNSNSKPASIQSDEARFFLASIIESLEDSVVSVDFNTIITSWNKSAERLYGYSAEEVIGKPLTMLTLPEDLQQVLANIERIRQGETVKVYETERIHKDGHHIFLSITLSPVKNDRGEIIGVSTIARDISRRKQSVEALHESQSRFNAALKIAQLGTFDWNVRTNAIILDQRSRKIFGFADGEGTQAHEIFDRIHRSDSDRVFAEAQDSIKTLSRLETEYRINLPDGTARTITSISEAVPGADGKAEKLFGVFSDVSARKQAEEKLHFLASLNEALRPLVEPEEIMSVTARMLGEHLRVNRCAYAEVYQDEDSFRITGDYTRETFSILGEFKMSDFGDEALRLMRKNEPYIVNDAEQDPRTRENLESYRKTDIAAVISVPLHKNGRFVAGMAVHQKVPRQWRQEEIELVQIVVNRCWESIERARTVRNLRQSEERFRALVSQATAGITQGDETGKFTFVNDRFCEIVGFSCEELLSLKMQDITAQEFIQTELELYKRVWQNGTPYVIEKQYIRKDGSRVWVNKNVAPAKNATGETESVICVTIDISKRKRAEEAARAGNELYEIVARTTNDAIWDWNLTTDQLTWNDGVRTLFGYAPEQISDSIDWWYEHLHPEDRERVVNGIQDVIDSGGQEWADEYRFIKVDGSIAEVLDQAFVIRDSDGKPVRMLGGMTDITERKQFEQALRESEERLRLAINISQTSTFEIDLLTDEVQTDEIGREIYGWSADEPLTFSKVQTHFHPDDKEYVIQSVAAALEPQGKDGFEVEQRIIRTNGETRWIRVHGRAFFDGEGEQRRAVRCIGTYIDITEQKRAEENLKRIQAETERQRRFYDTILSNTPDLVYVFDLNHRFTYANEVLLKMWGKTWDEAIGKNCWELGYEPWHAEMHDREIEQVKATKQPIRGEVPFTGTFGRRIYDYIFVPIIGADGEVEAVAGTTRDITELKQSEEALRESEEQLRALADTIPQLAWMAEPDGFIFWYNRRWYEYTGTTPDQMKGWGWQSVHDAEVLPQVVERWQRSIATGATFEMEFPLRRADGEFRWFLTRVNPLRDSQGNIARWFGTNTDIHENRIAQRNAEFLASVSEDLAQLNTVDEIMQTVGAKIGEYLNLSLCCFSEISEAEDKAIVIHDWHHADTPSIIGVYNLKEYLSEEFQRAGRAGEVFVVRDVYADPRTDGENYEALKIISFVCVPLVRDGQWRFLLAIHDSKPRNWREDEIELAKELAARIWTRLERARAEDERNRLLQSEQIAREEAQQANRLKDEFLATLSHELRTPLNSILGWSQMLRNNNLDEVAVKRAIETIERNARAQNQLIDDLLDVSRIITGKLRLDMRAVDLSSVIMSAIDAARPAADAKNIRLQTLLDPQAGQISGDPDRLQQVVWNLLSNAIKFTRKGGRVQVRLERVNSRVEIVVSDTGIGIEAEFLPFVFERFRQSDGSTTRRHGGLGLGLAIVRQLVELHGGTVSVESAGEGKGATFTVSLPILPVRIEPAEDGARAHTPAQNGSVIDCPPEISGLRVLLVDDETDSRDLLKFVLESCGAQVMTSGSAAKALEIIRSESFDVLISDIGMPEEDGYSLIRKIRDLPNEQGGNVPAIALTAYARAEDRVHALRSGFQMHIAKPVESSELITVVANLAGRLRKTG